MKKITIPQYTGPLYVVAPVPSRGRAKAVSPVRKARSPSPSSTVRIDRSIDRIKEHVDARVHQSFPITPDGYMVLEKYVKKLNRTKKPLEDEYLQELLDEAVVNYKSLGIFPPKTEYIISEILELSTHGVRDSGRKAIDKGYIEHIVFNDALMNPLLLTKKEIESLKKKNGAYWRARD